MGFFCANLGRSIASSIIINKVLKCANALFPDCSLIFRTIFDLSSMIAEQIEAIVRVHRIGADLVDP